MLLNNRCMDKTDMSMKKGEVSMEMPMTMNACCENQYPGVVCPPIYECPQVRCCHREICHEVPQE